LTNYIYSDNIKAGDDMFGKKLRDFREKRNLSQVQLYARSGVSQGYISDLEKGKKTPTLSTIEKLAAGLRCSVTDLLDADYPSTNKEIENANIVNI